MKGAGFLYLGYKWYIIGYRAILWRFIEVIPQELWILQEALKDLQALSVVESEGSRNFTKTLEPNLQNSK